MTKLKTLLSTWSEECLMLAESSLAKEVLLWLFVEENLVAGEDTLSNTWQLSIELWSVRSSLDKMSSFRTIPCAVTDHVSSINLLFLYQWRIGRGFPVLINKKKILEYNKSLALNYLQSIYTIAKVVKQNDLAIIKPNKCYVVCKMLVMMAINYLFVWNIFISINRKCENQQ